MNKIFAFVVFFASSLHIMAQYTPVINAKRPGFSESPFGVGTGVYQAESGIFYQKSDAIDLGSIQKSMGADAFLRTGLLSEKLEFNLNVKFQKDNYLLQSEPYHTLNKGGFSQFTVGAKYLLYMPTYKDPNKEIRSWKRKWAFDKKRLIPSVGIAAGFHPNLVATDYKLPSMSARGAVLLQNDFSDYLIWVNNGIVDYANIPELRTYGYISTITYSVTDCFSVFGEHQGTFKAQQDKEFKLGGGMAYLFSKDLQIGINLHWDMKTEHLNLMGGLGASWRLDKHVNKPIEKKTKNDGSGRIQNKKGGVFKNIFSKKKKRR